MHNESQFQHNVDAALARIVDPMQPFLIEDAKFVVDHMKPMTRKSLRLPLIETLDLTKARFPNNQASMSRLAVEHERHDASGYCSGSIKIVNLGNAPELKPFYYFHYTETPDRDLFALWTALETDEVQRRSPFGRQYDDVTYRVRVKRPDRMFLGHNAGTTFARLLGKPHLAKDFSRLQSGLAPT